MSRASREVRRERDVAAELALRGRPRGRAGPSRSQTMKPSGTTTMPSRSSGNRDRRRAIVCTEAPRPERRDPARAGRCSRSRPAPPRAYASPRPRRSPRARGSADRRGDRTTTRARPAPEGLAGRARGGTPRGPRRSRRAVRACGRAACGEKAQRRRRDSARGRGGRSARPPVFSLRRAPSALPCSTLSRAPSAGHVSIKDES